MLSICLFIFALLFTAAHIHLKKIEDAKSCLEVLLSYILFFNMGVMSLLGAYAHVFMAPLTASSIGWAPGSPFQYEVGVANLSYGILGILSYWIRGRFWAAALIGWSVFLLGCFAGHIINYYETGNAAVNNIGAFIWFNDLLLPLFSLALFAFMKKLERRKST